MRRSIIYLAIAAVFITGCQETGDNLVLHAGALRAIMSGNLEAMIDMETLSDQQNLYALGAYQGLKGEIQIFDNKPVNSVVRNGNVVIENNFDQKAALLVYASVSDWDGIRIPAGIVTKAELENFVFESAQKRGLEEKPFPFLVVGKAENISWHVVDWNPQDTVHTHEKHKNSGVNATFQDIDVEVLGFYSKDHTGIFTHHTTDMHLHFRSKDEQWAGHVDDLTLGENMILKLPKK